MFHGVRHDLFHRLRRAALPGLVDRVLGDRDQNAAGLPRRYAQRRHIVRAHQARIIADALARQVLLREPSKRAGIRNPFDVYQRRIGLVRRLQRVAPVGKQHSLVGEHEGRAERAGKPGRPGEALVGVRQVLVLVLVVMRHVEAIKALRGEFTAEERKMGPAVLRPTLDVECLSHAPLLTRCGAAGKQVSYAMFHGKSPFAILFCLRATLYRGHTD